jgi:hypothetical protein
MAPQKWMMRMRRGRRRKEKSGDARGEDEGLKSRWMRGRHPLRRCVDLEPASQV